MTDQERKFRVPVVFDVVATTRQEAAEQLHMLLTRAGHLLTDASPVAGVGDVFHPLEDRWFPEAQLKHVDGNRHIDLRLRVFHLFAETYADTPVFDMLADIFPEQPNPAAFRDESGELDLDAYGAAFDEFTERALDTAFYLRRPTDLLARVDRAERVRDSVAVVLDQHPLPVEPDRRDYLVTIAPSYEGEIEGACYARDHTQWQADFNRIARTREQELRRLLENGTPNTTSASRFEHRPLQPRLPHEHGEPNDDLGPQANRAVPTESPSDRFSTTEQLWTYRAPVEFEVSARTADEARRLVDEALTGDARSGTPAAVQQRQRVLEDGDVHGVLGWRHLVDGETPPSPTSRLERGALLSDLLRDRGDQLTEHEDPDTEAQTLPRSLRPDSPGR